MPTIKQNKIKNKNHGPSIKSITIHFPQSQSLLNTIPIFLEPLNLIEKLALLELEIEQNKQQVSKKCRLKINTFRDGSTSWNTISAREIPATIPSSFAKNWASTSIFEGIVAKEVTSPAYTKEFQSYGYSHTS